MEVGGQAFCTQLQGARTCGGIGPADPTEATGGPSGPTAPAAPGPQRQLPLQGGGPGWRVVQLVTAGSSLSVLPRSFDNSVCRFALFLFWFLFKSMLNILFFGFLFLLLVLDHFLSFSYHSFILTLLRSVTIHSFRWYWNFSCLLQYLTNTISCSKINIVWPFCYRLLQSSSLLRLTDLIPINITTILNMNVTIITDKCLKVKIYSISLFVVLVLCFVSEFFFYFVFLFSFSIVSPSRLTIVFFPPFCP